MARRERFEKVIPHLEMRRIWSSTSDVNAENPHLLVLPPLYNSMTKQAQHLHIWAKMETPCSLHSMPRCSAPRLNQKLSMGTLSAVMCVLIRAEPYLQLLLEQSELTTPNHRYWTRCHCRK